MLLPFISFSQNYYNVYFMNKKDTLIRAVICTKNIADAKLFSVESAKDYNLKPVVRFWKKRPKSDTSINYLVWK